MNKISVLVSGAVLIYIVVEVTSLILLVGVNQFKPSAMLPDIEQDYFADVDEGDLQAYLKGEYDALLGWHHKPMSTSSSKNCLGEVWTESFDSDGARATPVSFSENLINSYGDSYVKGGDINDDETWQFQLSNLMNVGVKNYAVGAFDPYQATLKIERHISEGIIAPIIVLGINEQNISRVVNLFRPFMYRSSRNKFSFKPGLNCRGGQCTPVDNLLRPSTETIDEVKAAAREASKLDYWARTKPSIDFPWSVNLVKLARNAISIMSTNEPEPLWLESEPRAAMEFVVSRFRKIVLDEGSIPVVLFIPTRPKKDMLPSYVEFKNSIATKYPDLVVVDVADMEFDHKLFKLKPSGACHPSTYGHQIIAQAVQQKLLGVIENMSQPNKVSVKLD